MTIRVRLAIAYAATLTLSLFIVGAVVWWQQGASLRADLDERLESELSDLADVVATSGPSGILEAGDEPDVVFSAVFDPTGRRVAAVPGTPDDLAAIPVGVTERQLAGGRYLLHARQLSDEWTGVAGASAGPVERSQAALSETFLMAAVVASALSLLTGWWLAGRALAPVGELTAEAAAIGSSDLARRLPVDDRQDELGRLAATLNALLDRLERGVRRQRAFLAAASHDLRTPISTLLTELELADRPDADEAELRTAVRGALGDAVRLAELANELLDLVSADPDGRALARSVVPLEEVIGGVVDHIRPIASARQVRIQVDVPRVDVQVDRVRMELALRNVVANAITYSPTGGLVEVDGRLEPSRDASRGSLAIDVLDRGPGIPDDQAETVFEPFQRGTGAVGAGSGLGLSAARAAIEAHHGSLTASARPGGGSVLSMRIPL